MAQRSVHRTKSMRGCMQCLACSHLAEGMNGGRKWCAERMRNSPIWENSGGVVWGDRTRSIFWIHNKHWGEMCGWKKGCFLKGGMMREAWGGVSVHIYAAGCSEKRLQTPRENNVQLKTLAAVTIVGRQVVSMTKRWAHIFWDKSLE